MKKIFLLLILFSSTIFGQINQKIDSIKAEFNKTSDKNIKAELLTDLANIYLDYDYDKSYEIINQLINLNKNDDCLKCACVGNLYLGHYYSQSGNFKKAISYYQKSHELSFKVKENYLIQKTYAWLGQTYIDIREFDKAEKIINEAINYQIKSGDKKGIEDCYFLLGVINYEKGFLNKAIENYILVEKNIQPDNLDANILKMGVYNNIAQSYRELKNYQKATQYVDNGIALSKQEKDTFNLMNISLNKGIIEIELNDVKKGVSILENCNKYFTDTENTIYKGSTSLFLGIGNTKLKKYNIAQQYFNEAEKIYSDFDDNLYLAQTLAYKAKNSLYQNSKELALEDIEKAYQLSKNDAFYPEKISILKIYIESLLANNKINSINSLLKEKDSLESILTKRIEKDEFLKLETQYQTEKKEQEIELLKAKNELSEKQKYIYIAIAGLLLVSGLFLFLGYRNKIKTAQKLNELNELKSRFFANISHEFRTPLTLIKSPVQQLQSNISNDEQNKQLQLIDNNANRMLELVDQLLELSKIDSGNLQIILKKGNLQHFFQSIVEPFSFKAKDENQEFTTTVENLDFETHFDKDIITKITSNLLDNAFKYNEQGKPIDFVAKKENENLIIQVRNYNNQLKEADYKKLFERFYQKDNAISGFGIGLALVKDLVELYEGIIKTDFNNQQISFTVELPLKKDLTNAVVINENNEVTSETSTPIEITSNAELPILLVADDNASIREVIKDIFATNYQILEAANGKEALKLAQKEIPDCIISDVMMPELDGFEFTNQIKSNELTSFIPVILVTAKTSEEAHLKALQNTADAFLTKPFNHEVLKATVSQQIQERKKLQERYSQELILKPTEVIINSVDEKFIAKLESVLEKAIPNSEFNAETFAEEMHISRMQLHRKLKSLFGVSATEFIRNERLKLAADLLKNEKLSVSEIAYNVGFNDVGYFSKCFKEMYHVSPSDYQKK